MQRCTGLPCAQTYVWAAATSHNLLCDCASACSFDYPNALADLTVGYMGVPYQNVNMTQHQQYVTVRNDRGRELLESVEHRLESTPPQSSGRRADLVMQTILSDDEAKLGNLRDPAPRLVGNIIAWLVNLIGPKGLEFAKYSIDYHYARNWLYVNRYWGQERAQRHIPKFAQVSCLHGGSADGAATMHHKFVEHVAHRWLFPGCVAENY